MTATCPECNGLRMRRHPANLVFDHGNRCALRDREDVRRVADGDLVADGLWDVRPTTDAERVLLGACGARAEQIPDRTVVSAVTGPPGYRRGRIDSRGVPLEPIGDSVAVVRRSWVDPTTGEYLNLGQLDPESTPDTTEETTA